MWNENFPDVPVERLFNFSPKDWRTKPTYNLKDQTDSVNAAKLPHLLALASIEDEKRDNTLTIVRGVVDLDNGPLLDNVLTLSLAELIKSKQEAPEETPEKPVNEAEPTEQANIPSEPEKPVKSEKTPDSADSSDLFNSEMDF